MVSILVDINLQCRICLRFIETGTDIRSFFESLQEGFKVTELFNNVFTITGNEALPKLICDSCFSTITEFNNLLDTFRETEDYLKNRSDDLNYTEEIIITEENVPTTPLEGNEGMTNKIIDETDSELLLESLKYSCTSCDDVFLQKWAFTQHMSIKHGIRLNPDQTNGYASKVNVIVPKSTPETILPTQYRCSVCSRSFESDTLRSEHFDTHKKFACTYCDAMFVKKDYLNTHLAKHSMESRFVCNECGKSLKYRSALARHKRGHLNIRQHICETCGMNFKENYTLLTHKRLKHSDDRKYPCSACSLTFKVKSWRDRHFRRRHTNEAVEYVCNFCSVSYKYRSSLTRHVSDKHSENNNNYNCEVCSKTYTNKDNLRRHVVRAHQSRGEGEREHEIRFKSPEEVSVEKCFVTKN